MQPYTHAVDHPATVDLAVIGLYVLARGDEQAAIADTATSLLPVASPADIL